MLLRNHLSRYRSVKDLNRNVNFTPNQFTRAQMSVPAPCWFFCFCTSPANTCSFPPLCSQPAGSVNLGKISILQLTPQPFDGYVLPTFISQCVCKLINIFSPLPGSHSPSGKYLFPQKWAWANLPYSSICCQLPIKWPRTLKIIAQPPSSPLQLLFLFFGRNSRLGETNVCARLWLCVQKAGKQKMQNTKRQIRQVQSSALSTTLFWKPLGYKAIAEKKKSSVYLKMGGITSVPGIFNLCNKKSHCCHFAH